ncbi:MAG: replicative DNA helicase [Gammaproteobacteria bacterium]
MRRGPSFERALIGAALLDPAIVPALRDLVRPADFTDRALREICLALEGLHADGEPIDVLTVADRLSARRVLDDCGGAGFLAELVANTPSAANFAYYAECVRREAQRRKALAQLDSYRDRLESEEPGIVLGELQGWLDGGIATSPVAEFTGVDLVMAGFDALKPERADLPGTGLAPLDRMLGGFQRGRLYVPTGRTSTGKSALTLAAAHHIASAGHAVGLFSLEMPAAEIATRLFAHRYRLNVTALTRRVPGIDLELERAYRNNPMVGLPLVVDDNTTELQALVARAMDWHHRHRIEVLFVDYLGLVTVRGNAPRHERIGEASRTLKLLAKRLAIPVIAAAQLNREPDKDERRPRLSDLRDSGSIEQDADVVIALNPTSEPDNAGRSSLEVGILKNRGGPRGWSPESVIFDGRHQRFEVQSGAE